MSAAPRGREGSRPWPRLLLVRSEHLGDVLFTLPAVAALRRPLPAAHLTYLARSGLEAIPARCPAVDETLHLPFPALERPEPPGRWAAVVAREAPRLRGRFDAALLFRPADPWAGALAEAAAVPVRLGYLEPASRPFLTGGIPHRAEVHAVAGALQLAGLHRGRPGGGRPGAGSAARGGRGAAVRPPSLRAGSAGDRGGGRGRAGGRGGAGERGPGRRRLVRVDLPCSPCGRMHDPPCRAARDPACVTGIVVGRVLEAVAGVTGGSVSRAGARRPAAAPGGSRPEGR